MDDDAALVAHLHRRAGFGPRPGQAEDGAAAGYQVTLDRLCATGPDPAADAIAPPTFDTASIIAGLRSGDQAEAGRAREAARREAIATISWWLQRMVAAERPLREKLTWFWHGHFATSIQKVRLPELMYRQNQTLREQGMGDVSSLATAMVTDPAMLIWLDGTTNHRDNPNENLARELLELFLLGHGHHGEQPYSETDVASAAAALTGTRIDRRTGRVSVAARDHDDGPKAFLGRTGPWDAFDITRIAAAHSASAPFVTSRLWSRLARPAGPDDPVVGGLAEGLAGGDDIAATCQRLFAHHEFSTTATRTGLVKQPVEWVVGACRSLGLDGSDLRLIRVLDALGQVPLRPPSVGGWPANEAWLTTGAAAARLKGAALLASGADLGGLRTVSTRSRPDAVADMLGVRAWAPTTRAALASAADDPVGLVTLALVAPEHLLA